MEARATLRPGQKGTKKLVARFGARLICVRYRYDTERKKRFTTVELIVDECDWVPSTPISTATSTATPIRNEAAMATPPTSSTGPGGRPSRNAFELVGLRVRFEEVGLREKVKEAGGTRNPQQRLWMLRRERAIGLGLQDRIADATDQKQVYAMRDLYPNLDTDA